MIASTTIPARIALELYGAGWHRAAATGAGAERTPTHWADLVPHPETPHHDASVVRIKASDLREAQKTTEHLHDSATHANGERPSVLLDVEILLAEDARAARAELALLDAGLCVPEPPSTIRYVGTPKGLAGLIADITVVGVADGVTLIPLATAGTADLVFDQVLPTLLPTISER